MVHVDKQQFYCNGSIMHSVDSFVLFVTGGMQMKIHIRLALSLFAVVFGYWFETDPALILDDREGVWK